MGVGALIGSMSLAFLGQRRPLVPLIIGGGLIFVTFELLLGATRSVEPAYIWVIFIGLSSMLMINTINVTVQYGVPDQLRGDRKSTRLNSSHRCISYAVFCLKKKK